jgi:protein SCO1/2
MTSSKNPTQPKTPRALVWALGGFAALLALSAIGLGALVSAPPQQADEASAIGGPFRLDAGDGKLVSDTDLRGAPFLVFFGYTHCPDVCPTTLMQLSEVLRVLGPQAKIKVLFITVDPERDTPDLMKEFAGNFDPRIIGLSGDRAAVDSVLKAYRVFARKSPDDHGGYSMDHSAVIYLMDRQGRFLRAFNLDRKPEQAAADLKAVL